MIINGEWWEPCYQWVDMGPCSCGWWVLTSLKKVERCNEK